VRKAIFSELEMDHDCNAEESVAGVRLIAEGSERSARVERRARRAVGRRDDEAGR
jgi:hypothetical protein